MSKQKQSSLKKSEKKTYLDSEKLSFNNGIWEIGKYKMPGSLVYDLRMNYPFIKDFYGDHLTKKIEESIHYWNEDIINSWIQMYMYYFECALYNHAFKSKNTDKERFKAADEVVLEFRKRYS